MPTQFKVEDVEAALIGVLEADAGLGALKAQISGLSSNVIDEQGNLIVTPPAVLALYEATEDDGTRDSTRKTYQSAHIFLLLCGSQDLSSTDKERAASQELVSKVRAAIAGQRLQIDGGAQSTAPAELKGVQRFQFDQNGIWYAITVKIGAIAQY